MQIAYVVESRTKKLPGGAFRSNAIASSREIVGLYQNFDESRTNLMKTCGCGCVSGFEFQMNLIHE